MNCIEQLHLDAIKSEVFIPYGSGEENVAGINEAASKSAEVTRRIAIEFADWLDYTNDEVKENCSYESWFEEFLKSKQPNDGIQTS